MQVLSVSSEIFPLIKTGGLADVTGALPIALVGHGVTMRSLVPGYPVVQGDPASLYAVNASALDLFVLDVPHLFDRTVGACATPGVWASLQNQGMKADVSWEHSAAKYVELYKKLLSRRSA